MPWNPSRRARSLGGVPEVDHALRIEPAIAQVRVTGGEDDHGAGSELTLSTDAMGTQLVHSGAVGDIQALFALLDTCPKKRDHGAQLLLRRLVQRADVCADEQIRQLLLERRSPQRGATLERHTPGLSVPRPSLRRPQFTCAHSLDGCAALERQIDASQVPSSKPDSKARTAACVRSAAPIFLRMCCTCVFTVLKLMRSSRAISELVRPRLRRMSTACSRGLREMVGRGCGARRMPQCLELGQQPGSIIAAAG